MALHHGAEARVELREAGHGETCVFTAPGQPDQEKDKLQKAAASLQAEPRVDRVQRPGASKIRYASCLRTWG